MRASCQTNDAMTKPKSIQVFPKDTAADQTIDALAKQLRTSRGGLVGLALDFFLPRLKRGEIAVVNGEPQFVKPPKTQAA